MKIKDYPGLRMHYKEPPDCFFRCLKDKQEFL